MQDLARDDAFDFLRELENTLSKTLPKPGDMEPWIRRTVAAAKRNDREKHLRLAEAAFLNGQALPVLFELIQTRCGCSVEEARTALLNEYYRTTPSLSRNTPFRWVQHPFSKALGGNAAEIYRGWVDPDKGGALTTCSPDFALSAPFPHSILFEGKYFAKGEPETAARTLVADIYQAFFYRGLPPLAATSRHPKWNFDYACLMAYDASPKGTLASAWKAIHRRTRQSLWEGANIYVMILGGTGR